MDEHEFLKMFKRHATKMKKVVPYGQVLFNLRNPERQWDSSRCPFFNRYVPCQTDPGTMGTYFMINRLGKVSQVTNESFGGVQYLENVYYWKYNSFSSELIGKMIQIIKDLQKK